MGRSNSFKLQLDRQPANRLATGVAHGNLTADWLVAPMKDAHETAIGRYRRVAGVYSAHKLGVGDMILPSRRS